MIDVIGLLVVALNQLLENVFDNGLVDIHSVFKYGAGGARSTTICGVFRDRSLSMLKYSVADLSDGFREALSGFMREMYGWEVKYYHKGINAFESGSPESDLDEEMRNDLLMVFHKYVVRGGRNYDRVESLVCGRHPEYDEERDQVDVIDVGEKEIVVLIRKTRGLASVFRLTFTVSDGVYKVAGRDLQGGEKWQKTYV